MKRYKVFDVTEMPKEIKKTVYDKFRGFPNPSYHKFYVHDYQYPETEYPEGKEIIYRDKSCGYVVKKGVDILSDWLMDNGAKLHEEILIKVWW